MRSRRLYQDDFIELTNGSHKSHFLPFCIFRGFCVWDPFAVILYVSMTHLVVFVLILMVVCFIDSEPTGQTWNNQFCFNYWWMNLVSFFNSSVSLTCIREIINSEHVLSVRFLVTFVRWFCPHANRFKILLYLRKKWMACVWNWVFEKVPNQYRVRTIRVRLVSGLDARRYNSERLPSNRTISVTTLASLIASNHFSSERRLSKLYQCATMSRDW